jgi:hypothetical protein
MIKFGNFNLQNEKHMRGVVFFISVLLSFSACKKKDNTPINTPVDNGPWGGVYRMISTETRISDTLDSTPYGGGVISFRSEQRGGEVFSGSLVINKTNLKLENLGYNEVRSGRIRNLTVSTGTITNDFISGTLLVSSVNVSTPYSINSTDSVKINEAAVIVRIPVEDNDPAQQTKYELIGNRLTLFNDVYRKSSVVINGQRYDSKRKSSTTTEYQKQ